MQLIRSKFDMTNLRTYVALTATIAFIAIGQSMNAQDDLDDLLADLEGEAPAATPAAPAPAAEEPAAEEPAAEEEPVEEVVEDTEEIPEIESVEDDARPEVESEEETVAESEEPAAESKPKTE